MPRQFQTIILFGLLIILSDALITKVTLENGEPKIYESTHPNFNKINAAATINYTKAEQHPSHFAQLIITTNNQYSDDQQAYFAGYLEGYNTADLIYDQYTNMKCLINCNGTAPANMTKFFDTEESWLRQQVINFPSDPYWQFISNIDQQYQGLQDGYAASLFGQAHPLQIWAFRLLNSIGDIFDIRHATNASDRIDIKTMTDKELKAYAREYSHCSALVKLDDGMTDIWAGHTAWFVYQSMLRIFKRYEFNFNNALVKAKKMAFSSYPGMLSSLDDFYLMDTQITVLQTTNGIYNNDLYDLVTPQGLYAWHRIRLANSFASSGPEWYQYFQMNSAGTYTNQYLILNYGLFKPQNAIQNNTLYLVEQTPGLFQGGDVTDELERGYFPSYNAPYFYNIYARLGYGDLDAKNNMTFYSQYALDVRGKIFRRDHYKVQDLFGLANLLRQNDYKNDPFSEGDPCNQICCRNDLSSQDPSAFGCLDVKVTNFTLQQNMQAMVVNGPTNVQQPSFNWTATPFTDSHIGQPNYFNFTYEVLSPISRSEEQEQLYAPQKQQQIHGFLGIIG